MPLSWRLAAAEIKKLQPLILNPKPYLRQLLRLIKNVRPIQIALRCIRAVVCVPAMKPSMQNPRRKLTKFGRKNALSRLALCRCAMWRLLLPVRIMSVSANPSLTKLISQNSLIKPGFKAGFFF